MNRFGRKVQFFKNRIDSPDFPAQVITAVAFLFVYTFVLSRILPQGINQVFTARVAVKSAQLGMLLAVPFFLFFYRRATESAAVKNAGVEKRFNPRDLLLLLLPMTPIVRYIFLNMGILSASDVLLLLVSFPLLSAVVVLLIPALVPSIFKTVLTVLGLSLSFVIFNMASLAFSFGWDLAGSLKVQAALLFSVFAICLAGYRLNKRIFRAAVAIFFLSGTINIFIAPGGRGKTTLATESGVSEIYAYTEDKTPQIKPDILLLTYESYVENETMLQYGIDNSEQENYLKKNGFHIYMGNYSVGATSLPSMSRMLDIRENFAETPFWMKSNLLYYRILAFKRAVTAGRGAVHKILKNNGYKTYGIFSSDYFFWGVGSFYDYSFPRRVTESHELLSRSILEGQFGMDIVYAAVDYEEYLAEKRKVLKSSGEQPRFLYTHNSYPGHTYFTGGVTGREIEIFKEGLLKANKEMRIDVDKAIKNNPDAIIIVCGDHGPFLTKNCYFTGHKNAYDISEIDRLDVQDRFGAFLAIRWPEEIDAAHEEIKILQDVFPVIFAHLFDDPLILNARIEPVTLTYPPATSGVIVENGIIKGGIDDGKPLFDSIQPH